MTTSISSKAQKNHELEFGQGDYMSIYFNIDLLDKVNNIVASLLKV